MGSDGSGPDILGVEVTPTAVRAIRLSRDDRKVRKAAECPVLTIGDAVALDPSAIGPALDEVMYQLGVDDRTEHLAAVTIGPRRAGVGSGPALATWLDRRARQLGENMVFAGKLGIAFCPQRALDTAIMICEQANITVSRIDFAPMAAARVLKSGTDTIIMGSGRGWRARLRDDEVLEALETADVAVDQPLKVVNADGEAQRLKSLDGVSLTSDAKGVFAKNAARFAPAVGAAVGIIDGSSANLLDGDIVRGRPVPAAFVSEVGGVNTGEIAGSRTTVSLSRAQTEMQAVVDSGDLVQADVLVEPPGGDDVEVVEVVEDEIEIVESEASDSSDGGSDADVEIEAEAVANADVEVEAESEEVEAAEADDAPDGVDPEDAISESDAAAESDDVVAEDNGDEEGDEAPGDEADSSEESPDDPGDEASSDSDNAADAVEVEADDDAESTGESSESDESGTDVEDAAEDLAEPDSEPEAGDATADPDGDESSDAEIPDADIPGVDEAASAEVGDYFLFDDVAPTVGQDDDTEVLTTLGAPDAFDEPAQPSTSLFDDGPQQQHVFGTPYDQSYGVPGAPGGYGSPGVVGQPAPGYGYDSGVLDHGGQMVHPNDPINSFSPEPGAESVLDRRNNGRGLALVVAALILFSLAIAVGILVTQG